MAQNKRTYKGVSTLVHMAINPADTRPPYRQIADALYEDIRAGHYVPGDQIPSARALAAQWGVSLPTASAAIQALRDAGVIYTRSGAGSYVKQGYTVPPVPETSTEDLGGVEVLIEATEAVAPADVATRLGGDTGISVPVRRRMYVRDDRPIMLVDSYYPPDLVAGTKFVTSEEFGRGEVMATFRQLGHEPDEWLDEIIAHPPTPQQRQALHLADGVPVIRRLRTLWDTTGSVLQVTEQILAADQYVLRYRQRPH